MKSVVGIWCGIPNVKDLLQPVHGIPLLKLTIKRVGPCFCLVPWKEELDWLAGEIKAWGYNLRRCHHDERIAMRDLVVDLGAEIGSAVPADCAVIDKAEIMLAEARVEAKFSEYRSPRVKCFDRATWLGFGDSEEWGPYPFGPAAMQIAIGPRELDIRWDGLRARKET